MKLLVLLLFCIGSTSVAFTQAGREYADSLKMGLPYLKDDTARMEDLYKIGFATVFSYADSSEKYVMQALALAQKIKSKQREAQITYTLGLAAINNGDYANGLNYSFRSLPLLRELRDTQMIAWNHITLMMAYTELEDYSEAYNYGHYAEWLLSVYSKQINPYLLSMCAGYLSVVFSKDNRLDSALYYGLKANIFYYQWGKTYETLGSIYFKKSNTDSALYYYRQGLSISIQYFNYISLIDIYNSMSYLFESNGKIDSAIFYALKSVNQEGRFSYPQGRLNAADRLAKLYKQIGVMDSSVIYFSLAGILKDSLYNRKKIREVQSYIFNRKLDEQEKINYAQAQNNKLKLYGLIVAIIVFIIIMSIQWRNNKQKQKTNTLLFQEKQKVEDTLSTLKSTQAHLIQSEKMASLGELTSGIAHEIQNPLNFVNNFSDVNAELVEEAVQEIDKGNISDAKALLNDIKENEQKINHHGKRADAIVKGMLQHSQAGTGTKELTDINKLADEYLRLSYHGLRAKDKSFNVTMKTDFDETIGKINIIPQDIGRVLLNLYNNAFYDTNSKLKSQNEKYEPVVTVTTKRIGDKVSISVKDNGNGIPQNIIDKIFQPFFTTKPTGQGTGLGLSLSYDIVKAHGGEIKVETKEGEGSEFIIQLPVV